MKTKIIVFLTIILVVSMVSATCYRGKDGFVCVERGKEYPLSELKVKPKKTYGIPADDTNPYRSFYSGSKYRGNSTDRDLGNGR